jgi:uncharacterized protein (DUF2147 family)
MLSAVVLLGTVFAADGVATPGVATPGVSTPGVSTPGVSTPGVSTPGVSTPGVSTPGASPLGLWKTFDDKTGSARGIVRVYEENGKLFGRIERSFTPGSEKRVCEVCTDERKSQPIIGLLIIRDMKGSDGEYSGGDILDPDTGSVYRCKFHLDDSGTRLILRGFIGISLLGRTQTWLRQDSLSP